jgi:hypothetical protein
MVVFMTILGKNDMFFRLRVAFYGQNGASSGILGAKKGLIASCALKKIERIGTLC